MTKAGRDEDKPDRKARKPKLEKETVKDLDPQQDGSEVKGGDTLVGTKGCYETETM